MQEGIARAGRAAHSDPFVVSAPPNAEGIGTPHTQSDCQSVWVERRRRQGRRLKADLVHDHYPGCGVSSR
jgi:hypothetical protein